MAYNDPSIYDTREQLDFSRKMAESLLKGVAPMPSGDMAKLPGTWMYSVPHVIQALSGAQYRDLAGDRESKLISNLSGQPRIPAKGYGIRAHQPPSKADIKYSGGDPDATAAINDGKTNLSADVSLASGDDFINKLIQIESGGNPNARTGSYRGLGQFGKEEEQRYGINDTNWNNPEIATAAIKKHMSWLYPQLEQKLGRSPTPGELYLAHQQGAAGGPALLSNPDQPAWKVVRPYYNSDQMAKLAITGNIPNGHYLKKIPVDEVKAGDFSKLWTSRFDKSTDQQFAGKMNLGGPPITEGENQPTNQQLGDVRLAQAGGPNKPVITTNPPVSPTIQAPGYGVPPANPVLTQDQLDATLRLAPAEQRAKILEDYRKSRIGEDIETPLGKRRITPPAEPGGQPIVTDMPNKMVPLNLEGLGLMMIPDEKGQMRLMTPDGKDITSVEDLMDWKRRQKSMDIASEKITEQDTGEVGAAKDAGIKANSVVKTLNTLDTLSKSGNVPRGPFSKYSIAIRQFLDNIGLSGLVPVDADLGKAEVMQKINAELAAKVVTSFTNRGTNFELDTYMKNNPGLLQSKEGMDMLLDIVRQEYQTQVEIGKIANRTTPGNTKDFYDKVNEYQKNNPIVINDSKNNKKINTYPVRSKQDVDKYIKSGQHFILPDGSEGYKK